MAGSLESVPRHVITIIITDIIMRNAHRGMSVESVK